MGTELPNGGVLKQDLYVQCEVAFPPYLLTQPMRHRDTWGHHYHGLYMFSHSFPSGRGWGAVHGYHSQRSLIPDSSYISCKSHTREALRWSLDRFFLFQEEGLNYCRCETKAVHSSGLF